MLRKWFTPRLTLLTALVLVLVPAIYFVAPTDAYACCGFAFTITYYSDGTYTTEVGSCSFDCLGDESCTGTTSAFHKRSSLFCCGIQFC